jgi:hypothetical protein
MVLSIIFLEDNRNIFKKKREKGGWILFVKFTVKLINVMFRQFKEKNKKIVATKA